MSCRALLRRRETAALQRTGFEQIGNRRLVRGYGGTNRAKRIGERDPFVIGHALEVDDLGLLIWLVKRPVLELIHINQIEKFTSCIR